MRIKWYKTNIFIGYLLFKTYQILKASNCQSQMVTSEELNFETILAADKTVNIHILYIPIIILLTPIEAVEDETGVSSCSGCCDDADLMPYSNLQTSLIKFVPRYPDPMRSTCSWRHLLNTLSRASEISARLDIHRQSFWSWVSCASISTHSAVEQKHFNCCSSVRRTICSISSVLSVPPSISRHWSCGRIAKTVNSGTNESFRRMPKWINVFSLGSLDSGW